MPSFRSLITTVMWLNFWRSSFQYCQGDGHLQALSIVGETGRLKRWRTSSTLQGPRFRLKLLFRHMSHNSNKIEHADRTDYQLAHDHGEELVG